MFSSLDGLQESRTLIRLPITGKMEIVLDLLADVRGEDDLIADYWATHPRFLFLKNVGPGARVLDFGAGDGGMSFWPGWMHPIRDDITLTAMDIKRGVHFDRYADFEVVDVTKTPSRFDSESFDAVVCAMTLEYIENARQALTEVARLLRPHGSIYIEYSGEDAVNAPYREHLEEYRLIGDSINFYEDEERAHLFNLHFLDSELQAAGFKTAAHGTVRNRRLAPELLNHGMRTLNPETTSYGLRLAYQCVSYAIADRLP